MKTIINKSLIKRVFILEDDTMRINWFKEQFDWCDWFITKQVGIALEELKATKYELIFLDHDLEDSHYTDFFEGREPQKELTGQYISENLKDTINFNTTTIIHSMNPIGQKSMKQQLPHAFVIPFSELVTNLEFYNGDDSATP